MRDELDTARTHLADAIVALQAAQSLAEHPAYAGVIARIETAVRKCSSRLESAERAILAASGAPDDTSVQSPPTLSS